MASSAEKEPKRILVVDDDEDIVSIIVTMLKGRDWQVFSANTGEDALGVVSEKDPDVILLDIMMPHMNGIEVLKRVRMTHPRARIIMITAYGDVESYLDSMELGAYEYINKPFDAEELLAMIEKVATV